jgi:hypothetical protein
MSILIRYSTFKQLKKSDTTKAAVGASTAAQKSELESFFKQLSKRKESRARKIKS